MNDELTARYTAAWTALEALCLTADRARSALAVVNANPSDRAALDRLESAASGLLTDGPAAVLAIDAFTPIAERMAEPIDLIPSR